MTVRTIDEYLSERPPRRAAGVEHLRPMAQEAVRMDALTGDPTWDHFLSYIEAATKLVEAQRDQAVMALRHPDLVNIDALARCKARITRLDAQLEVFESVIRLPKLLKESAEKAKGFINAFEADQPPAE